jgi:hypothetical protein
MESYYSRHKEERKAYYEANKKRILAYQEQYREDHRGEHKVYFANYSAKARLSKWDKLFGWVAGAAKKLFDSKVVCDLCGEPFGTEQLLKKSIDHNHLTGEYRGVIHCKCNLGISHFNDNPQLLQKAIAYVNA